MALVNAYCSVAELRAQFADNQAILDEGLLEKAINATSRAVDRHCSGGLVDAPRRFWRDASVTSRVFRADRGERCWVEDFSGTTGLVVKTDDNADGTYETTWTIGTDYLVEPLNAAEVAVGDTVTPHAFWEIVAVGSRRFPVIGPGYGQRPGVQVTARFGWSSVPEEVNSATLLKAASLFKRKEAPFGVVNFGEFGAIRIGRTDIDVIDLLSAYMKTRSRTLTYHPQAGSLFHWRASR